MRRAGLHPDRGRHWMRRMLPVAARQRRVFAAALAAGLGAVAATVAVPVVIGRGVDAAAAQQALRPWALSLGALAAARLVLGFANRYGLFRSAHRIEADLRNLVFERLTELSFSYWDRTQTGQVISKANSDIRSIQLLFAFAPIMAMQLVMLVLGTVAMLWMSLPLTLVALAPLPLVLWVGTRLRDRVFPLSWVTQARMADLATVVDENIGGAQIVRTFAQEQNQVALLARSARRLRWAGAATADARARHAPVMEALPRLSLALILLVGGLLAIDGRMAVGDIVAFNAYVLIMAGPFRMIGFVMIQWQRASAAAQRVFEILDEAPEITERPDALPLVNPAGRVELENATFTYATNPTTDTSTTDRHATNPTTGTGTSDTDRHATGTSTTGTSDTDRHATGTSTTGTSDTDSGGRAPVIDGLSMVVEAGETVAVVGRTGSGKSTIARLLPRFYDVDRGAVRIDGIDVRDLRLSDLRRAVAVVNDEPFLFAASIHHNVAFARPDADAASIAAALEDASAEGFVASMPSGASTRLGERGATISGGQRQRLAIARALLADPAVLVLDDATSAIDTEVEERIHAALRQRRSQRTTILIAHRLSTIALADRVVFVANGRVAATGSHHHMLSTVPAYAELLTDLADKTDTHGPHDPSHSTPWNNTHKTTDTTDTTDNNTHNTTDTTDNNTHNTPDTTDDNNNTHNRTDTADTADTPDTTDDNTHNTTDTATDTATDNNTADTADTADNNTAKTTYTADAQPVTVSASDCLLANTAHTTVTAGGDGEGLAARDDIRGGGSAAAAAPRVG